LRKDRGDKRERLRPSEMVDGRRPTCGDGGLRAGDTAVGPRRRAATNPAINSGDFFSSSSFCLSFPHPSSSNL
jgi:hypothetical protein